ncbi:MAG: hypothetical protein IT229_02575 [Flavobacteriales bacterium]|nr:hypothetical protein [Flavobacteriales bacterium]
MKNRLLTLCLGIGLFNGLAEAQLQRIVLQGNGAPQVFTDLASAVVAAQSDDKIYLSGGVFNVTGSLVVDKPLHFIGAGISPDSSVVTNTTSISPTGAVQVLTAGSGSSFSGIRFLNTMQYGDGAINFSPTGIVFQRCEFVSYAHLGAGSTTVIDECVFRFRLYGYDGEATITRSIFSYGGNATHAPISAFGTGGLTMDHCTVLLGRITNSPNCSVSNCVFTRTSSEPFYQSNGAIITNNLIAHPNIGGNMTPGATSGNVLGEAVANMFVDEPNGSFDWTDDLHLQSTSIGVGMASDGTDVGIHGTNSPFKPGGVPYNPHFRAATIAPATNTNGDLPVNIRVAAQPN